MIRGGETPYDDQSGVPIAFPILPNGLEGVHSWHHHSHPHDHELLQGTGGMAVRGARLQWVEGPGGIAALLNEANDMPEHIGLHPVYHRNYDGPPLPADRNEQFGYLIMVLAGYIPEYGLDLSKKYGIERKIKPEERARLQSGELRISNYEQIHDFFIEHIIYNGQGHNYDTRELDDFLSASQGNQRFMTGDLLIQSGVINAVQPWIRPYKEARRKGLLNPDASSSAVKIVQKSLGREKTRQRLIEKMHFRMAGMALQTEVRKVPLPV